MVIVKLNDEIISDSLKKYFTENRNLLFLDKENTITIINNNSILRTFYINLFTDLKIKLEENEIQYNTDMYEELIPLKYSIIKKDNNIYLNSVEISL